MDFEKFLTNQVNDFKGRNLDLIWQYSDIEIDSNHKTYKLKDTITSEAILPHALSHQDITLEQIKQHTNEIMELIYV